MLLLKIIKNSRTAGMELRRVALLLVSLLMLLLVARAQAQTTTTAYYSKSAVIPMSDIRSCPLGVCTGAGAEVSAAGLADLSLAARVSLPALGGTTRLRLALNGTASAGYRAGALIASAGTLLGLQAVQNFTIRTYLSTDPNTIRDERTVSLTALGLQLLSAGSPPEQLEFISTQDFNQVEIVITSAAAVGGVININYAYGIAPNQARTVAGYVSRLADGSQVASGCAASAIQNPANAADASLTNYATISTITTAGCPAQLKVKLDGTAPASYKAGFVIGSSNNLVNVGLINSGLVLRTYDAAGTELESSSSTALLGLSLLPDGRSLVSFQATKPFSSVSIERTGVVTALDNLQLYYGLGVASTTVTPRVLSNFATGANSEVTTTGVCALCSVDNKDNAEGANNNSPATINTTVGALNAVTLKVDLNGPGANVTGSPGKAGNRAGFVIGGDGLVDADLLNNLTLSTYDATGALVETKNSSSLLAISILPLPDGRRTVSFNTTKDFSTVGITIGSAVGVLSSTKVYYAFADDSNGQINITSPSPLPVSLISFTVRRVAGSGAALVSWATATEINSASFVVERSANPLEGFTAIGQVAAAGRSTTKLSYSLPDNEAAQQTTTLYYRLRQIDLNGTAYVSPVAVLAAGPSKASFSLYPNPATGSTQQVTINATADLSAGYSVSVYTTTGQLLSTRTVSGEGAAAPLTVPTTGLASGMYHVVLRNAAGQSLATQRLQVAN